MYCTEKLMARYNQLYICTRTDRVACTHRHTCTEGLHSQRQRKPETETKRTPINSCFTLLGGDGPVHKSRFYNVATVFLTPWPFPPGLLCLHGSPRTPSDLLPSGISIGSLFEKI